MCCFTHRKYLLSFLFICFLVEIFKLSSRERLLWFSNRRITLSSFILSSSFRTLGKSWKTPHSFIVPHLLQKTSVTLLSSRSPLLNQPWENLLDSVLSERAQHPAVLSLECELKREAVRRGHMRYKNVRGNSFMSFMTNVTMSMMIYIVKQ